MTLQIGTILIAKEDIKMEDGSGVAIIKGNEYKIKDLILDVFIVKSELFDNHEFDIEDLDKYFTIKRYTLTDLQTRTDIMVRIENEEEAKKLGNKWYNTHYFSDELLYGHIKGVKEIIYLEADELEGRTLVPSIDLIDLEEKEESKVVESHHVKQLKSIDEIDLGEGKEARYFVDIRGGCGAVRDRLHKSYDKDYHGLHNDTTDVIEYRHGYQENGVWNMKSEDIQYLNDLCEKLNKNNILSNETVLIATDADCVERIQQLESEIARLKGELDKWKDEAALWNTRYHHVLSNLTDKTNELNKLRESPQISQDLEKRERMAWELMLRSVQVENSKHYSLSAEYCLNEVDTFLAKSKEVGNGK